MFVTSPITSSKPGIGATTWALNANVSGTFGGLLPSFLAGQYTPLGV